LIPLISYRSFLSELTVVHRTTLKAHNFGHDKSRAIIFIFKHTFGHAPNPENVLNKSYLCDGIYATISDALY
jgi:hypothetical protein